MKLKFDSGKNTQLVTFKVDPTTNSNLTALRNLYSKEARRRVTTGEIVKKLLMKKSFGKIELRLT